MTGSIFTSINLTEKSVLDFHSARNDVTEYSMSLDKFISSLQTIYF